MLELFLTRVIRRRFSIYLLPFHIVYLIITAAGPDPHTILKHPDFWPDVIVASGRFCPRSSFIIPPKNRPVPPRSRLISPQTARMGGPVADPAKLFPIRSIDTAHTLRGVFFECSMQKVVHPHRHGRSGRIPCNRDSDCPAPGPRRSGPARPA